MDETEAPDPTVQKLELERAIRAMESAHEAVAIERTRLNMQQDWRAKDVEISRRHSALAAAATRWSGSLAASESTVLETADAYLAWLNRPTGGAR